MVKKKFSLQGSINEVIRVIFLLYVLVLLYFDSFELRDLLFLRVLIKKVEIYELFFQYWNSYIVYLSEDPRCWKTCKNSAMMIILGYHSASFSRRTKLDDLDYFDRVDTKGVCQSVEFFFSTLFCSHQELIHAFNFKLFLKQYYFIQYLKFSLIYKCTSWFLKT